MARDTPLVHQIAIKRALSISAQARGSGALQSVMTPGRRKCSWYLCASVWALACAAPIDAAAAGSVTLLSQERIVEATASSPSGTDAKSRTSVDAGPFSDAVSASSTFTGCLSAAEPPSLGTNQGGLVHGDACVTFTASASASQDSLIVADDGAVEVRARGSMSRSINEATARSRLTSTFLVEGTVPFILQGDGALSRVSLSGPTGAVFDFSITQGDVSQAGYLTEGSYTLVLEAAGLFGNFNIRFTADAVGESDGPRCSIRMTRPSYGVGDVVAASQLRVDNVAADPVFVELKMWLRLPDGSLIPARNEGADGSLVLQGATTYNLGPLDVMGVGPDLPQGLWEFGCRLLNPVSGQQLYENNALFEIR